MKAPQIAIVVLACALCFFFGRESAPRAARAERDGQYQLHVSSDGTMVRMNTATGQLHVVTEAGAGDLPEKFAAKK